MWDQTPWWDTFCFHITAIWHSISMNRLENGTAKAGYFSLDWDMTINASIFLLKDSIHSRRGKMWSFDRLCLSEICRMYDDVSSTHLPSLQIFLDQSRYDQSCLQTPLSWVLSKRSSLSVTFKVKANSKILARTDQQNGGYWHGCDEFTGLSLLIFTLIIVH